MIAVREGDLGGSPPPGTAPQPRALWRAVAVPPEHGGWGLTLEPVVLGLLARPGLPGLALGAAAFVAFLARTPLKVVLVDRRRGRWLARSRLALQVLGVEAVVLVALVGAATARRRRARRGSPSGWPRLSWPSSSGSTCAAAVAGWRRSSPGPSASAPRRLRSSSSTVGPWPSPPGRGRSSPCGRWRRCPTCALSSSAGPSRGDRAAAWWSCSRSAWWRSRRRRPRPGSSRGRRSRLLVLLAGVQVLTLHRRPPRAAVVGAQQLVLGLALAVVTGLTLT